MPEAIKAEWDTSAQVLTAHLNDILLPGRTLARGRREDQTPVWHIIDLVGNVMCEAETLSDCIQQFYAVRAREVLMRGRR